MFRLSAFLIGMALCAIASRPSAADQPVAAGKPPNSIVMDVFVRGDLPSAKTATDYATALQQRISGLEVRVHDVLKDPQQLTRLYELTKKAGRAKPVVPAFYCCGRMYFGFVDASKSGPAIEGLFTAHVYTRNTCPKCRAAKAFLKELGPRWPAIQFRIYEISKDAAARARWEEICRSVGSAPGLPTIDFAGHVIIGYQGDAATGAHLERLIEQVSGTRPAAPIQPKPLGSTPGSTVPDRYSNARFGPPVLSDPVFTLVSVRIDEPPAEETNAGGLALPEEAEEGDIGPAAPIREPPKPDSASVETIDVPIFGELRPSELGMPLFTLLVGLVDGFNPCAMWVLVFLLSVLVNIQDRRKILLIAGTFVIVSGVAYFAFMAAWLNLFMLIGIVRPVQIALGLLALFIGLVNVKDFFAFKKGISLSIPESRKPGLYRRVRQIVSTEYLTVAVAGAVMLAIVVNIIELLCTAGLPALYTQVLTIQAFPAWKNYSYLALYIAAYMFDDTVLVVAVVATLSRRRLQEREGRWLKLVSGLVILAIGAVMIFRPSWLQLA